MSKRTVLTLLALITLVGVFALNQSALLSQEPTKEQQEEMMKQWLALMTPGEGHKRLEPYAGTWTYTSRAWMAGPNNPPIESKGEADAKWVLGNRFLRSTVKGQPMGGEQSGMPAFEGIGTVGYDNFRNLYTMVWIDNYGTATFIAKGSYNPITKAFTYYGEMDEPSMKVVGRLVKMVETWKDNDNWTMTMYDLHAGDNYKAFELSYTRKK